MRYYVCSRCATPDSCDWITELEEYSKSLYYGYGVAYTVVTVTLPVPALLSEHWAGARTRSVLYQTAG